MQKQDISSVVLTGSTMISGTPGLLLFSFFDPTGNHWGSATRMNITQWVSLLFLALCCSVLAYFAYNIALSRMAAPRVTVYFYIEPVIAILPGIILLGEQLNWHIIVGMVAIGVSVIMVNLMKK